MPKPRQTSDSKKSVQKSDQLSLIVFKDQLRPRSFKIPLSWFNRLGVLFTLAVVIILTSVAFSIRSNHLLKNARKDFAREMEEALKKSETELVKSTLQDQPLKGVETGSSPKPLPEQAVSTSHPPTATAETSSTSIFLGNLFSLFAPGTVKLVSDLSQSPISIQETRVFWKEKSLHVHFELHYIRDDGGNQKGQIYILARGPSTLLIYPNTALEPIGSAGLISEKRGESFSVSRLRLVNTVFNEMTSREQIKSLEVIIVGANLELLSHQSISLPVQSVSIKKEAASNDVKKIKSSPLASPSLPNVEDSVLLKNENTQPSQTPVPTTLEE